MSEKIRLGGMALPNGVLVHGPHSWACAIRHEDGRLEVASARKRFRAADVNAPFLRGPARLVEALAILPIVKRRLPAAKLPMQSRGVVLSMLGATVAVRAVRDSRRLRPAAQELLSGLLSLAPAAFALRGSALAQYHGAEHIAIGTYEHGEGATKEHERLQLDDAPPRQRRRAGALEAGARAAAPAVDGRSVTGAARGRRGGAASVLGARA